MSSEDSVDVVVIGAGMAGLAAARVLAEAGRRVVVLEASQRAGGRIRTVRVGAEAIELGAEFIHGRPPELWALIEEAGLETDERTGSFFRRENGELVESAWDDEGDDEPLERLKEFAGPDCSFVEYAQRLGLSEAETAEEIGYVEGFNAADAREASAVALGRQQRAEDAIEGDRSWRLTGGYEGLTEFLRGRVEAAGGEIRLDTPVTGVAWDAEGVRVTCASGERIAGRYCVVTVPLGVLQAGLLKFSPAIPEVEQAAARLRMGQVCRFTLVFKRRLWPESMSFLLTREMLPTVWWTRRPGGENTLTGWVGGPRAGKLLGLTDAALRAHALRSAGEALNLPVSQVIEHCAGFHTYDWSADRHVAGAYSWVPVGGLDASQQMSEHRSGPVLFAGEHTDTTGHWGTVHAALRSGLRAARQVTEGPDVNGNKADWGR